MSNDFVVQQEIHAPSHVLCACLIGNNLLLCSILEEPYFTLYQIENGKLYVVSEDHPAQQLVKCIRSTLPNSGK